MKVVCETGWRCEGCPLNRYMRGVVKVVVSGTGFSMDSKGYPVLTERSASLLTTKDADDMATLMDMILDNIIGDGCDLTDSEGEPVHESDNGPLMTMPSLPLSDQARKEIEDEQVEN